MLAAIAEDLPPAGDFLYEPKWDGFRAIVYRGEGSDLYLQSRELKPLDRYFPVRYLFWLFCAVGALLSAFVWVAFDQWGWVTLLFALLAALTAHIVSVLFYW